jgi:putative ABC transport system permease protein
MLLFALSAMHSTAISADDRIAVAAGAEGAASLRGSWELDEGAVSAPPDDPLRPPPDGPVPGVRTPPLPQGNTVVWRTDVTTLLDDDQKDLQIIDPARFRDVALWGDGADLAAARAAVAALAAEPVAADGTVRTIVVADPASAAVDLVRVNVGYSTEDLAVAARVAAFPGLQGRPMYVVAADAMFAKLGPDDPRLRPRANQAPNALFAKTMLWNSAGATGVQAVTASKGVQPDRVDTAAQLRRQAAYVATSRARGYQLAIAGYLALLAILTLCIYAQRTALLRRPTDLMLARVGLGRKRIRQARALEFVLLAAVAFAAAVAGVAALAPLGGRLLDDQPGLLPRFAFQLSPVGLAVTAGAAVVATALAVVLTTGRSASAEEDAYRDD